MNRRILVCRWDPYILAALRDEGAEVALLFDTFEAAHFHVDEEVLKTLPYVFRINSFDDMDELGQVATQLKTDGWIPDQVVSLSEFSQFGAGYLAQVLGCAEPTLEMALKTRDKRAMKLAVRAAGVSCTDFVSLRTSEVAEGVRRTTAELGFPVVVKPAAGLGTLGTSWVHTEEQLSTLLEELGSDGVEHFMMAERPVSGDEFHVDAIWVDGVCKALGIMRYIRPRLAIETAGVSNGSVLLPREEWAELYADVEDMHQRVNEALGIRDGITHLEFFKAPDERRIHFSEIASRFAGGGITQTYRALGEDLRIAWIKSVVDPERPAPYADGEPNRYVGWINLAPATEGKIVAEPSQADIDAFDFVLETVRQHGVGDVYGEPHPSAWCLFLIYGADSLEQFEQRGQELEKVLNDAFRTEPTTP
ncbi:ATP-grasp domain-containing protein [Streptomyces sp. TP-A0874]|uniref:ATP-grasp domain-containing protein n=1 Tax=Streptomyces sp. TP-A0874 TaxID=549819 RepID=UPI0008539EC2|nr:ATP-grasp domain-containing protein [Streptomyces sp. TP-A0874]